MCIYLNLMILIKIIRGFISAECELFEDINKKLLTHIADVCP